jgi:hypothetical protein
MPFITSPQTDPPPRGQLFDLLKETGRLEEGKFLSAHKRVSKRLHVVSHLYCQLEPNLAAFPHKAHQPES